MDAADRPVGYRAGTRRSVTGHKHNEHNYKRNDEGAVDDRRADHRRALDDAGVIGRSGC